MKTQLQSVSRMYIVYRKINFVLVQIISAPKARPDLDYFVLGRTLQRQSLDYCCWYTVSGLFSKKGNKTTEPFFKLFRYLLH